MDSPFNSVNMSEVDEPAGRRWEPVGEAAANDDNDTTLAQYDTES